MLESHLQTIIKGDSVKVEFDLPTEPDGGEFTDASFVLAQASDDPAANLSGTATIENGHIEASLTPLNTQGMAEGIWRWQIRAYNEDNSVTACRGLVDVVNPIAPKLDFNMKMVQLLEQVLLEKINERGDIVSYMIGDRNIFTSPIEALRKELNFYKQQVRIQKKKGRVFWKRIVN